MVAAVLRSTSPATRFRIDLMGNGATPESLRCLSWIFLRSSLSNTPGAAWGLSDARFCKTNRPCLFEFALRSAAELLNEIQQLGRDGTALLLALGRGSSLDWFGVIVGGSSMFSLNELQIAPTHSSSLGWPASIFRADFVDRVHGISRVKGRHEGLDVLFGWDGVDAGWAMPAVSSPGEFGQFDGIELFFTDVLKIHGPVQNRLLMF